MLFCVSNTNCGWLNQLIKNELKLVFNKKSVVSISCLFYGNFEIYYKVQYKGQLIVHISLQFLFSSIILCVWASLEAPSYDYDVISEQNILKTIEKIIKKFPKLNSICFELTLFVLLDCHMPLFDKLSVFQRLYMSCWEYSWEWWERSLLNASWKKICKNSS